LSADGTQGDIWKKTKVVMGLRCMQLLLLKTGAQSSRCY
jgi:hypothetical protein